ncbi:hypothetical protein ANACOL_01421 [Anaerotruncus colihominis DSM 17241]|uniref:Uncharacterized protein n=1 Tax=Anaerotruncus colihominis DSM 17241 TaxID=445972 RepID=B0P9L5_9FIRM|nr:hypothetical protein ANACOL_01421 [Anaerotruncus colihominis DSM 17241]
MKSAEPLQTTVPQISSHYPKLGTFYYLNNDLSLKFFYFCRNSNHCTSFYFVCKSSVSITFYNPYFLKWYHYPKLSTF